MSAYSDSLTAIMNSLLAVIAAQTAAWEAAGCPPDWSVDGESESWSSWLSGKLAEVERLSKLIQNSRVFYVRSRHRG